MEASTGGLNTLGEESDGAAPLQYGKHAFYTQKVGLIEVLGDNTKLNEKGIDSLSHDILITAYHVYVLAAEAVERIDEFQSGGVGGEKDRRLILDGIGVVIVMKFNLIFSI